MTGMRSEGTFVGRVETEATIKIWVEGRRYVRTAEGNGPVNALDRALRDAIGELAPDAAAAGVTLSIEPLHPMYASDRCVVSTLGQALDIAADFDPSVVGVTVDTFHIWWDPDVLASIERAGREGRIATYQVCDWKTPLPADVLLGRHYPGDGVIDGRHIELFDGA